jgi:hypothetical protein
MGINFQSQRADSTANMLTMLGGVAEIASNAYGQQQDRKLRELQIRLEVWRDKQATMRQEKELSATEKRTKMRLRSDKSLQQERIESDMQRQRSNQKHAFVMSELNFKREQMLEEGRHENDLERMALEEEMAREHLKWTWENKDPEEVEAEMEGAFRDYYQSVKTSVTESQDSWVNQDAAVTKMETELYEGFITDGAKGIWSHKNLNGLFHRSKLKQAIGTNLDPFFSEMADAIAETTGAIGDDKSIASFTQLLENWSDGSIKEALLRDSGMVKAFDASWDARQMSSLAKSYGVGYWQAKAAQWDYMDADRRSKEQIPQLNQLMAQSDRFSPAWQVKYDEMIAGFEPFSPRFGGERSAMVIREAIGGSPSESKKRPPYAILMDPEVADLERREQAFGAKARAAEDRINSLPPGTVKDGQQAVLDAARVKRNDESTKLRAEADARSAQWGNLVQSSYALYLEASADPSRDAKDLAHHGSYSVFVKNRGVFKDNTNNPSARALAAAQSAGIEDPVFLEGLESAMDRLYTDTTLGR